MGSFSFREKPGILADNKLEWSNMVFLLRDDDLNTQRTVFDRAVKAFDWHQRCVTHSYVNAVKAFQL